jgi:type IV secretion system protein VirB10
MDDTRVQTARAQEAESAAEGAAGQLNRQDPNLAFQNNLIESSQAEEQKATQLKNLEHTIAQGKIVEAVLETAIDTDLPGTLRAIISRDTFAEAGRKVLIPKGSRLIGAYNTGILRGQRRVFIVWTRVIRPDGVDIQIGSPATDPLGRAGVPGFVDNKYLETFSTALLTSVLSIGVAAITDSVTDTNSSSTTSNNGTTTTGTAAATAAGESVKTIGKISGDIVNNILDLRPTITVDQGTRINIFVNRDLKFPEEFSGAVFIQ